MPQYVCPICAELFDNNSDIAATICGHTFHLHCLSQWFTNSQTCPRCRQKLSRKDVVNKLYFDIDDVEEDSSTLKNQVESLKTDILLCDKEKRKQVDKIQNLEDCNAVLQSEKFTLQCEMKELKMEKSLLISQLKIANKQVQEVEKVKFENKNLQMKIKEYTNLEAVLNGRNDEVEQILLAYGSDLHCHPNTKAIAMWCLQLKKQLQDVTNDKSDLQKKIKSQNKEFEDQLKKIKLIEKINSDREINNKHLTQELKSAHKKIDSLESKCKDGKTYNKRFVNESPAPEFHSPVLSDSRNMNNDSVIIVSDESQLEINISNKGTENKTPPANFSQGYSKYNLFKKQRTFGTNSSPLKRKNVSAGEHYNGFGGHSKPDIFPASKQTSGGKKLKQTKSFKQTAISF